MINREMHACSVCALYKRYMISFRLLILALFSRTHLKRNANNLFYCY